MGQREQRFEAVYVAHGPHVLAYLRRRTDQEAARDVAAEVFTVAWRRLDEVHDPVLPWLLGVARRQLANHHRSLRRQLSLAMRIAQQRQADPVWSNSVLDPRLCAAISELSNDDQELLLLVAWDELTPTEAAVVLGISSEAARSRLHRARRRLDTALQPQEVHDESR